MEVETATRIETQIVIFRFFGMPLSYAPLFRVHKRRVSAYSQKISSETALFWLHSINMKVLSVNDMNIKELQEDWDLIVIGGGITGAGILREAARMGLRVLLTEQKDFAWGTSSRSSKMVHGGLRYLKEGRLLLTMASVKERERLLREASGLVEPLGFLMPVYSGHGPWKTTLGTGLLLYDIMARKRQHSFHSTYDFSMMAPYIRQEGLRGGFRFLDAQVDDARLVLRLINESVTSGAYAMNYTYATRIIRDDQGEVTGVEVEDTETQATKTFSTRAVINATGAWAEKLHPSPKPNYHLRPLRGSHLIFPSQVFPLAQAVALVHPTDNRPVFAVPWEGAVLFGTTDVEHREDISAEPVVTHEEVSYLMKALHTYFPSLRISPKDCLSTIAGLRPVLSKGKLAPSKESRDHVVWTDKGLVTVTGGKLTTFRRLALDALEAAMPFLPSVQLPAKDEHIFPPHNEAEENYDGLSHDMCRRLSGRYGKTAKKIVEMADPEDLSPVPDTHFLWAELPFAAKYEQVRHLTDLLLRRVRIGLLTPQGGKEHLDRIQKLCEPVLSWDTQRWKEETDMYLDHWKRFYSPPASFGQE
ncbi:MAG: FAD-dependent oxidoreductase [Deltaproteobacteria bacterium]|nr:MAG: FAD-dependent oxidoreductase [Deltaproteobacteria bacterium]